jgi:hypothetical protein
LKINIHVSMFPKTSGRGSVIMSQLTGILLLQL